LKITKRFRSKVGRPKKFWREILKSKKFFGRNVKNRKKFRQNPKKKLKKCVLAGRLPEKVPHRKAGNS